MKKYLTLFATFLIMVCLGGVYGWSVIASELIANYGFSATQSQLIFSSIIAIFPTTMIFVGQIERKVKHRYLTYASGALFLIGYLIAGYSHAHFLLVFTGIGLFAGVATGLGYWVSLNSTVRWFPERKGLITGIITAGYGGGAIVMSQISKYMLGKGYAIFEIIVFFGIAYGIAILLLSNLVFQSEVSQAHAPMIKRSAFIKTKVFRTLFIGLFFGTFAGLLIIGSLKTIGLQLDIQERFLFLSISLFAVTNFLGRLVWGYISDILNVKLTIFMALLFQGVAILMLNLPNLSENLFLIVVLMIGFGFGGNFVLFAKKTAQVFGVIEFGVIYPFVFIGKAIAGIAGPISGGLLFDLSGTYFYAILLAGIISFLGSALYLFMYLDDKKVQAVVSK